MTDRSRNHRSRNRGRSRLAAAGVLFLLPLTACAEPAPDECVGFRACGPAEPSPLPTEAPALIAQFEDANRIEVPPEATGIEVAAGHNGFDLPWYRVRFEAPASTARQHCEVVTCSTPEEEDTLHGLAGEEIDAIYQGFDTNFDDVAETGPDTLFFSDMPSRVLRKGFIVFPDGPDSGTAVFHWAADRVPN